MKESLRQAAGSLLVVGLGDKELTAMERTWLKLVRPAGIILFKRNIVDRAQTRALLAEATSFCIDNRHRFASACIRARTYPKSPKSMGSLGGATSSRTVTAER